MPGRTLCAAVVLLIVLCSPRAVCEPDSLSGSGIIAQAVASLHMLTQLQKEVVDIHPYLQHLHPVAVVEGDSLYILDVDSALHEYTFRKTEPVPFPMGKGIRASFPLACYDGRPACVVSIDVFDAMRGYATIFHEFVHCTQYVTCENRLKEGLQIMRAAMASRNYSWEINHPFPYEDPGFVESYAAFLRGLAQHDSASVRHARQSLRQHLSEVDHDYLIWVMWKEGFARFIENEIRSRYGLAANHGGKDAPYNRVAFYFGGEQFIRFLIRDRHDDATDVEGLFRMMQ